jgi:hypothetical protein
VQVESNTIMMDQDGIHAFGGGQESNPLSTDIQLLFQPLGKILYGDFTINWSARDVFHAAHYPHEEVVRYFVSMGSSRKPYHALAYHTRTQKSWIEEYPFPIMSSAQAVIRFARVIFCGSEARQTFAMSQGYLDGLSAMSGTTFGTITDFDLMSITDGGASFPTGLEGRRLSLTTGRGKLQSRTIHSATDGRIQVMQPWAVLPEVGDMYQIGGVHYRYVSALFDYSFGETEQPRKIGVNFYPTETIATMFLKLYFDLNLDPVIWVQDTMGVDYEGISASEGFPELGFRLDDKSSFAQQRMPNRKDDNITGPRSMVFEMIGVAGQEGASVSSIVLDGIEAGGGG